MTQRIGFIWIATLALASACDQPLDAPGGDAALDRRGGFDQPIVKPPTQVCRPVPCGEGFAQDPVSGCCVAEPAGPQCGDTQCASYEECCNASCGVCVLPDEQCTQEVCDPVE